MRENRKFIREALEADVASAGDPQGRLGRLIEMLQDDKQTFEQRVLDEYNIYIRVCDEIVRPLLLVAKR